MLGKLGVSMGISLLGMAVAAGGQAPPGRCALHVHITDEDGKDLPKAFALIHGEHGSNQQLTPDRTGQVKISLHSGLYDLFVSAMGFVPQAQIVDLRTCKPVDVNVMLTIDSEHSGNNDNN